MQNGQFIVLGEFTIVNNFEYNFMVRLNANGSIDTTFNIGKGFNSKVTAFALQNDGKYVVVGNFTSFNGIAKSRLLRLMNDGTLDTTFDVFTTTDRFGLLQGISKDGLLNDIVVEPNGKIITSGPPYVVNHDNYRSSIVRFNSNGTVDPTFRLNYYTSYYPSKLLYALDGSIYFNIESKVRKCDNSGNLISSFNNLNLAGDNTAFYDNEISFQNNKILVVTDYRDYTGVTRLGYHRLNLNGSLDKTFNPHFGPNISYNQYHGNNTKLYTYILPDNKILVYGNGVSTFTTYNDIPVKSIIRLHENGELDTTFNVTNELMNGYLNFANIKIKTNKNYDGSVYILVDSNMYKLNNDGSLNKNFGGFVNFEVTNDNKIIFVSDKYQPEFQCTIVRLNSDGEVDNTFTSPIFQSKISYFEILNDNKILLTFNELYGYLVLLNSDGTLNTKHYTYMRNVRTKTINNKIYLSIIGKNFLSRLNSDYSLDTTFKSIPTETSGNFLTLSNDRTVTFTSDIKSMALFSVNDTNGISIGSFSVPSGKWDSFSAQNCENILLSGTFIKINNTLRHNICRLTVQNNIVIPAPVGAVNQLFTQGQTLADLFVQGQNIQWYEKQNECAFNGNMYRRTNNVNSPLPNSTLLINGTTYFASQTINGIENNNRLPVTVTNSLKKQEFVLNSLKTFPNPIKDYLNLSNTSTIDKIEIFDILGKKLSQNNYFTNSIKVNFSTYKAGMYFINVFSEERIQTIKIIKE